MELKRKELHKWLRDHKNPEDNKPWTDKTYDQYYSDYFTNKEGEFLKKLNKFSGTSSEIFSDYSNSILSN